MDYKSIISKFNNPKRTSPGHNCAEAYQCKCPAHADNQASLTVSLSKAGKIILKCHAGCSTEDILNAVGLNYNDLFSDSKEQLSCLDKKAWYYATQYEWTDESGTKHKGYGEGVKVAAVYTYRNGDGKELYSKVRFEGGAIPGKLIRYYTIDRANDTATSCKREDAERVLYRLPEFQKEKDKVRTVYIVEGEKDCETLRKMGGCFGCATTPGGASDWREDYARYFKGLNVVILRDNDNAGLKFAQRIARDLKHYAYCVKIVNPSTLDHGDVTDYLTKEGGTAQGLKEICDKVTEVQFASWVKVDDKGNDTGINPGILSETIAEHEKFFIVRNPRDDKDSMYIYDKGVYVPLNKPGIKAMIREYVPTAKVSDNMLNNVCNLLFATNEHIHSIDEVNTDDRYINVKNGLYDISSRRLAPHDPAILSTAQYDFEYDPENNNRKVFDKYMTDLCTKPDGSVDQEQVMVIQEYLGFCLSNMPISKVKAALILWSRLGNSGKSVLIRLLTRFLGLDRVASIKLTELKAENRFILGSLPESRLIVCGDESNANVQDSSIFKAITGGDPVKIEPKSKQGFSYIYRGGFAVACNGLPCFVDDKGGHLFDRLLIIPCEHHITDEMKDPNLDEKLSKELPAIFNWALEGLHRLIDNGFVFTKSKSSELSKEDYHRQMDNVYRYVCEFYEITHDYNDRISKKAFDNSYYEWATADRSIKAVEKKNLAARMEALGVYTSTGNAGDKCHITVYRGIKEKDSFIDANDMEDIPF